MHCVEGQKSYGKWLWSANAIQLMAIDGQLSKIKLKSEKPSKMKKKQIQIYIQYTYKSTLTHKNRSWLNTIRTTVFV